MNEKYQADVESQKIRLIRAGGGAKQKLLLEEQILLTLFYLRQNVTFQVLGLHFHVTESTAYNYLTYWQEILQNALPSSLIEQIEKNGEKSLIVLENFNRIRVACR